MGTTTLDSGAVAVWAVITALLALSCIVLGVLLWGLKNELRNGIWQTALGNLFSKKVDSSGSQASISQGSRKTVLQRLRSSNSASSTVECVCCRLPPAAQKCSFPICRKNSDWEVDVTKLKMKYIIGKGNFGCATYPSKRHEMSYSLVLVQRSMASNLAWITGSSKDVVTKIAI